MEYRKLGHSGLKLSAFSLGSWVTFGKQVHMDDAKHLLQTAYDAGINFFDNAEGYEAGESEKIMGEALHQLKLPRDTFCVSSKVFWGGDKPTQKGLSKKHVHDACHAALKRLKVDYLDLFFCHRPDIDTPIEETVRAMHHLVEQGKILYWGTSEWSAAQIMEAYGVARQYNLTPPTMEQPQYNMFDRAKVEGEYQHLYQRIGLGTTIWSPLKSGLLTGKYLDGVPDGSRLSLPGYEWLKDQLLSEEGQARLQAVRELKPIADELGASLTHLALAWCLKNPNVSTVILGASRLEQLTDNLKALALVEQLDEAVMARIDTVLGNRPPEPERFGQ